MVCIPVADKEVFHTAAGHNENLADVDTSVSCDSYMDLAIKVDYVVVH